METADHLKEEAVSVLACVDLVVGSQIFGAKLTGIENRDLAKAGLPDERVGHLGAEVSSWLPIDDCDRL